MESWIEPAPGSSQRNFRGGNFNTHAGISHVFEGAAAKLVDAGDFGSYDSCNVRMTGT
jgi:hypothetical protein